LYVSAAEAGKHAPPGGAREMPPTEIILAR